MIPFCAGAQNAAAGRERPTLGASRGVLPYVLVPRPAAVCLRLNAIQPSSLMKGQEMKIETIHDVKDGSGAVFTPKEAEALVKLVTENTRSVPDEPERGKHLIMPRGIVMKCFTDGKGDRRYIGQYRQTDPTAGAASMPRRVYQIDVEAMSGGGCFAFIYEDDHMIAQIETPLSRNVASRMALRSLYWFLAYRDKRNRRRWEQRKKAKAAKREAEGGAE